MTAKKKPSPMAIWEQVQQTDPTFTKSFKGTGGFSGTAFNSQYMWRKATELFGPCGTGWGYEILDEKYVEGSHIIHKDAHSAERTIIHVLRVGLWYMDGEDKRWVEHYGQTTFVGKNKYGPFTDEEAPKKSLTDALMKCMSMLGFGADVYLGLYDDNKYVEGLKSTEKASKGKARDGFDELIKSMRACKSTEDLGLWYKKNDKDILALPPDWTEHLREEYRAIHGKLLEQEQVNQDPDAAAQKAAEDHDEQARLAEQYEQDQRDG